MPGCMYEFLTTDRALDDHDYSAPRSACTTELQSARQAVYTPHVKVQVKLCMRPICLQAAGSHLTTAAACRVHYKRGMHLCKHLSCKQLGTDHDFSLIADKHHAIPSI